MNVSVGKYLLISDDVQMTQRPDMTFVDSWSTVKVTTCHIHYSLTDSAAQYYTTFHCCHRNQRNTCCIMTTGNVSTVLPCSV